MSNPALDDSTRLKKRLDELLDADVVSVTEVMDVLKSLENVPMTLPILKKTKVGVRVGNLRKHADGGIAEQAKALVKRWKKVADVKPKPSSGSGTGGDAGSAPSTPVVARSTSGESLGVASAISWSTGSLAPSTADSVAGRSVGAGGGASAATATGARATAAAGPAGGAGAGAGAGKGAAPKLGVRGKIQGALMVMFGKYDGGKAMGDGSAADMARRVEDALYVAQGHGFEGAAPEEYTAKFRTLSFNTPRNPVLLEALMTGALSPEAYVKLDSEELMADSLKAKIQAHKDFVFEASQTDFDRRNRGKILAAAGIKESSGDLKCKNCGGRKIMSGQKQTRSADEPMTTFCECLDCGWRWRFC